MDREEFDVIVVGSGAAGLTSALVAAQGGLKTLVLEKSHLYGGTTALSSGGLWIPQNPYMAAVGQKDTAEEAYSYLRAIIGDRLDVRMTEAYLKSGPEMLRYLEKRSEVRFYPIPLSDYRPDVPGAKLARTIVTTEYDGRRLGGLIRSVRNPLPGFAVWGSFQVDPQHAAKLTGFYRSAGNFSYAAGRLGGFLRDVVCRGKGTYMANGNALIGRLLKSGVDAGVVLRRSARVDRLVRDAGRVAGVVVDQAGREGTIYSRRGIVLASGGFGANRELRKRYIPLPEAHLSAQPVENVGDGLQLGESAGGILAEANAANGVWAPCSAHYSRSGELKSIYPHFGPDRGKPGFLIVGQDGRRFANEAAPYQDFVNVMNARGITTAWFIGHKTALRRYGMGVAAPFPLPFRQLVRDGYLIEAGAIPALAEKIGVPPGVLGRTVKDFNSYAARGEDPEFHRGANIYDNAQGDPTHAPNPNLGAITDSPFYAVRIHPGDCSTILGLNTTVDAEVLDRSGEPIPGLFAVGLDQNSMMRGFYPGGGSSLGPAMTFAYRAGLKLAGAT